MTRTRILLVVVIGLAAVSRGLADGPILPVTPTVAPAAAPPTSQPSELAALSNAALIEKVVTLQTQLKAAQGVNGANAGGDASVQQLVAAIKKLAADEAAVAALHMEKLRAEREYWSAVAKRCQEELDKANKDYEAKAAGYQRLNKFYNDLNTQLTTAVAQRDFLVQQVKLLREQIAILKKEIDAPATRGGERTPSGGTTSQPEASSTTPAQPTIKGEVKAVTENQTLATLDVGANDGVRENMEFTVFRSAKYLAKLVVTRVDAKTSVGRLEMVQAPVQAGDKAWNRLTAN